MDNHLESGDLCVAFQMKNNIFAIPTKDTLGIVELDGLIIPIVDLPGAYDDLSIVGNYIVILELLGRRIGILTTETHLVRILANSILEDRITGQKSFVQNGKTYLMLNISQLYKELDI